MSDLGAALLAEVVADPEEDAPRLVYADWLEEQGAAEQAELLRLSCAPASDDVKHRKKELEEELRETIRADFPRCNWVSFDGGLVTAQLFTTSVRGKVFQKEGPAWLRRHGITGLCVDGTTNDWSRLANAPVLAHVRCLSFFQYVEGNERAAALGASPHLAGLYSLDLAERLTPEGIHQLLQGGRLTGLCSLGLMRNRLGPEGVQAVADWPGAENLRRLDFSWTWQGDASVAVLASAPRLRNLTTLNLHCCEVSDGGLQALADSPHLTRLAHLTLTQNSITEAGAQSLIRSPLLPRLRWLALEINTRLGEGALALAQALRPFPQARLVLSRYLVPKPHWEEIEEALGSRILWR